MAHDLILIDRTALLTELQRVFNAPASETLVNVMDKVATQVHAAGVPREDFSELKLIVKELAEAQKRTEARVSELAEAQQRTEARLERLEQVVIGLTESIKELVEAQRTIVVRMDDLQQALSRMTDAVGEMRGTFLEIRYRDKAVAYFGRILRKPRVVSLNDLWDEMESSLPPDVLDDVLLTDLVVQGLPRKRPDLGQVWLALEVSWTIDTDDIYRARRRAQALQQAGYRAFPAVAGEKITEGAQDAATVGPIVVVQDGRVLHWDEALAGI